MSDSFRKNHCREESRSAATRLQGSTQLADEMPVSISQELEDKGHQQETTSHPPSKGDYPSFLSISSYYELVKAYGQMAEPKTTFPFASLPRPHGNAASSFFCFCGSRLSEKRYLVKHWEHMHGIFFESLEYMVAYASWAKCGLQSKLFAGEKEQYLRKVKSTPYQLLSLPEDLKFIMPRQLRQPIRAELRSFLSQPIRENDLCFKQLQGRLSYRRHFLSQEFMQAARDVVVKYFTVFDRSVLAFVHNMTFKDSVVLVTLSLVEDLQLLNADRRRKKGKEMANIAKNIECIGWNFQSWVDLNYQPIFSKHSLFHGHVELQPLERYSDTQGLWQFELLAAEYLIFIEQHQLGKEAARLAQLLVTSINQLRQHVSEDENLVVVLSPKKRKGL